MRNICITLVAIVLIQPVFGQSAGPSVWRTRYYDGVLSFRAGGGFTKYLGQFVDNSLNSHLSLGAHYNFIPEFSLGVGADFGKFSYRRRAVDGFGALYDYQFGGANDVPRSTWFSSFTVECHANVLPQRYLSAYLIVGAGYSLYGPQDYADGQATVQPASSVRHAFTVPVGIGLDYFIERNLAVSVEARNNFVFADDLDAFPSRDVYRQYYTSRGLDVPWTNFSGGRDGYGVVSLGLKYFLFEDTDPDGDGLSNRQEEALKTDPFNDDTDGDGLSDYAEVKVYDTNPLSRDTDGDGRSDYAEVVRYHSDPLVADTAFGRPGRGAGFADTEDPPERGPSFDVRALFAPDASRRDATVPAPAKERTSPAARPNGAPEGEGDSTVVSPVTDPLHPGQAMPLTGVTFRPGSDELEPSSESALACMLPLFELYPALTVEIRGHTDSEASEKYNEDLSLRRAMAVHHYFIAHGVRTERLFVAGFGERMPVASNATAEGRARNRRIELLVERVGPRATFAPAEAINRR